jgi:hypothetical protein
MPKLHNISLILTICVLQSLPAAEPDAPEKPIRKITPGKVIVPTEKMRRIWGELISVDLETRSGTFRAESEDKVYRFSAMPYAEMLHHGTNGDLSDFKVGERAIFRMHVNEQDEWFWLTYIQDEMNMLRGHGEYYFVDSIDATKGRIGFTWAKGDKTFIRDTGLFLKTDDKTLYWKNGKPAKFSDIKIDDKLRAKTHGVGKGQVRVCWELFREKAAAIHTERLVREGLLAYVDEIEKETVKLTLFRGGAAVAETLLSVKKGVTQPIRIAPAGVNVKPTADPITAEFVSCQRASGAVFKLVLKTNSNTGKFQVGELARVWVEELPVRE